MATTQELYDELTTTLRNTAVLASVESIMHWDEQTHLPAGGVEHRAAQMEMLSGLVHQQATKPRLAELLEELSGRDDLGSDDDPAVVNVREARRDFERATKLPQRLVEELARTTSLSQQAWVEARAKKNFEQFRPWLEKIVKLKQEQADAYGFGDGVRYDALLEDYEPGATTAKIKAVFDPLRDELVPLVEQIKGASHRPDTSILTRHYPAADQQAFAAEAAQQIGFDFDRGRLDESTHPFCSGIGPGDCRLTTRYDDYHFSGAFFGTLHEAGHGMYEQGLRPEAFGTPMGHSVSLGIHESQSRLWENFVGRSREFWEHFFPSAEQVFSEALRDVDRSDFHFAVNAVEPSFIRVESDEVTYNLHIMLRFELEQALIGGDLQPADVPDAWNETFDKFIGIYPTHDAEGCLQDIHWSGGLFGYFPTYALGNMYAAQFHAKADNDLGGLGPQFSRGQFAPLKQWLNEHIHSRGRQFPPERLVKEVTGNSLSPQPLVEHLRRKYSEIYRL